MRILTTLLALAALSSGCTKTTTQDNPDADTNASQLVEAHDLNKTPLPPAVLKLAEAYLAALPGVQRPDDSNEARKEFVRSFFSGFTSFRGTVGLRTDAEKQGFKAGQEFRNANPDKLKETMESYGYVAMEAEGIWTVRFEHSGFKSLGKSGEKEWWFSTLADTVSDLPEGGIPETGVTIRATGFLSPQGAHGHFGAYDREFFATKISKVSGS